MGGSGYCSRNTCRLRAELSDPHSSAVLGNRDHRMDPLGSCSFLPDSHGVHFPYLLESCFPLSEWDRPCTSDSVGSGSRILLSLLRPRSFQEIDDSTQDWVVLCCLLELSGMQFESSLV